MIINSLCNTCFQTFRILVETKDIPLVRQVSEEEGRLAPCPRLCGGKINLVGSPSIEAIRHALKDPISITGTELYQAVNGAGLPDELPKSRETIEALLKANKVVGADIEQHGDAYYLNELQLENGVVLHLSSGLRGAQVLKVTRSS